MKHNWESGSSRPVENAEGNGLAIQAGARNRILVIDDDLDWLAECCFMLEAMGQQVIAAHCAEEALAHAADPDISTVIVDYSLPSFDGLALIEQLQAVATEEGRQMRFIMVTGHPSMDVAIGAMRASAVDFLQKPVSQDGLKMALQRANGLNSGIANRTDLLGKLSSLSTELQRLSNLIDDKPATSAEQPDDPPHGTSKDQGGVRTAVSADHIRTLLRNEAKRRKLGGGMLFGDPAWDMLLDLLLAKLEGRAVSVSSACIASGAPTTTALRLINRLIDENVLFRVQDEQDGRRNFLRVHKDIEKALLDYLADQDQSH